MLYKKEFIVGREKIEFIRVINNKSICSKCLYEGFCDKLKLRGHRFATVKLGCETFRSRGLKQSGFNFELDKYTYIPNDAV